MQFTEGLLVSGIIFALLPLTRTWALRTVSPGNLAFIILSLFLLHVLLDGARWQLAPAYLVLILWALGFLVKLTLRTWLRNLLIALGIAVSLSALLAANLFPVGAISPPVGPYTVGTFGSYLIDQERTERYEPTYARGISFRAWYPTQKISRADYERETLFRELYAGEFDLISFLFSYMADIETNSYLNAPISNAGPFPLVIFNHGLFMTVDQNPQLVEHLASHGYVVISLSHPFESLKVDLPDRGSRSFSMDYPPDVGFSNSEVNDGGIGDKISNITGVAHSDLMHALYTQIDRFNEAVGEEQKGVVLSDSLVLAELQPLQPLLTEKNLRSFFDIRSRVRNRSTAYWVEDIQFLLDELGSIEAPIADFAGQIDPDSVGVMGHSYGGSVAGEFCKIDGRCTAGINLDGTQFGANWNKAVPAPFLLINSDTNLGGNNYAYYPPGRDFFDLHIPGSEHPVYIDSLTVLPVLRALGLSGDLPYQELATRVNTLSLAFFNEYLKGHEIGFKDFVESAPDYVLVRYP